MCLYIVVILQTKYNYTRMDIRRENIGHLNELVTIDVSPSDYQQEVEKSLKELKRKASIPGFRKGMVPMGMVVKMYGKSVRADEIVKVTNDKFYEYLKDNNLNVLFDPIAHPEKTVGDFEKTENFSFSFEIGLRPEITVNYDEAKKVVYYKVTATAEEINTEVAALCKRAGTYSAGETVAEEDFLIVSVTPADGREKFTSTITLDYVKTDELKRFIGKKLGDEMEFDIKTVFKSDYECATFLKVKMDELESVSTTVHITLDSIHHIVPSELNADFFTKVFPDGSVSTEAELREIIKQQIELRHVNDTNTLYRYKIMEKLVEDSDISLPDDFIKRSLVDKKEEYTAENIDEKYGEIKKSINYQLIEEQVAKECHVDIEREEILDYLDAYVRQSYFGTTQTLEQEQEDRIKQLSAEMMKKEENIKNAYDNLFFEKLIQALREKLKPKTKELSFKEFVDELSGKKEEKASVKKAKKASSEEDSREEKEKKSGKAKGKS